MHRVAPILLIAACAAGLLAAQPQEDKPAWHSEWRTAQRIARQENKPIFAVLVCRH